MNKVTKSIILGTAAIAALASTFEVAAAGDGFWRNRGWHNHQGWRYHNGPRFRNRAVAAGVIGLTAGVVVGSVLSQPRVVYRDRTVVYDEPDVDYVGPVDDYGPEDEDYARPRDRKYIDQSQSDDQAQDDNYYPDRPQKHLRSNRNTSNDVAQQGTLEPWTAQWRSYCKQRFASFNATTGTYKGYDGKSHFCTSG